mgnify:CR=1 FL=1
MTRTFHEALITVTSPGSPETHLCASSPAIAGTQPGELPARTLCDLPAGLRAVTLPVLEVGCLTCLAKCGPFLCLPGWATGTSPAK